MTMTSERSPEVHSGAIWKVRLHAVSFQEAILILFVDFAKSKLKINIYKKKLQPKFQRMEGSVIKLYWFL